MCFQPDVARLVIPALGRLRQEDLEFQASLGYIVRLSQTNTKNVLINISLITIFPHLNYTYRFDIEIFKYRITMHLPRSSLKMIFAKSDCVDLI
jgi:hypothetical protein